MPITSQATSEEFRFLRGRYEAITGQRGRERSLEEFMKDFRRPVTDLLLVALELPQLST